MFIERVQVEEGFLSGLDLRLTSGLTVLIGPRGTGKTSVIELIRFCLNVKGYTEEAGRLSRDHAAWALASGEITVTIADGDRRIVVSRTLEESEPRASDEFSTPIILSQNEIESVGFFPNSRLRLIDGFLASRREPTARAHYLAAQIESQTVQIRDLSKEIESLKERLQETAATKARLSEVVEKEVHVAMASGQTKELQANLKQYSDRLTANSLSSTVLSRSTTSIGHWKQRLDELISQQPSLEQWPDLAGKSDPLAGARTVLKEVGQQLQDASRRLAELLTEVEKRSSASSTSRVELEGKARELRTQIERLQQGAGSIAKEAAEVREKLAHLGAAEQRLKEQTANLGKLQTSRAVMLDELEGLREARFSSRQKVAERLNKILGPRVKVQVTRSAQYGSYIDALSECLRGSGLKYRELSASIAARVSPRELIEAAEEGRFKEFAQATSISEERAARVLAQLRGTGSERILTCDVEDGIQLFLLDGKDYKDTEQLSTGQRCTVILPILLCHSDQTVIIDQPEDHLDNAFIVDTVVRAITQRNANSQLLFATHNANIPVLGNAARVVVLGSDGQRAFIRHSGTLMDKRSVEFITDVMEGGREAFRKRAVFYEGSSGA